MSKTRTELQRERLSQLLTNRQAILIFGTGITMQATAGAATSSWAGLLNSGIDHCVGFANFTSNDEAQKWADARRADLRNPDPASYVRVAGEIERALKDLKNERQAWLTKAIGELRVRNDTILKAIKQLTVRFNPKILTTNYDTLLSKALDVGDITWGEVDAVIKILNGNSPDILHVHGLWSKAETVVLGTESYDGLLQNRAAQTLQQAFTALNSLVFIGCGDGVKDDNIGALLKWFETALPNNAQRHYILLRDDEIQKLPSTPWLVAVSYGSRYDELPDFLNSLTPVMDKETIEKRVNSAKGLIDRLVEAWMRRNQEFKVGPNPPSKSVSGSWQGQQTQQAGPADEPISYPITLELAIADGTITGAFSFKFGPDGLPAVDESLKVRGGLDQGRFLHLRYEGDGDDKLQFGALLLELAADGDTLIGNDVGYGYTTRQTLIGLTRLRRSAPL